MHLVATLMRLYTSLLTEIAESGQEGKDTMSSQQVITDYRDCYMHEFKFIY